MERDIRKAHDESCQQIMQMIVDAMSEKKIVTFCNACNRNGYLTSHFGMSWYRLSIYKEGWYFCCEGTRSRFAVWAWDRDGEIEIGRKPKTEKLNLLWSHSFADMPIALKKKYYTI